ncbi:conserved hypothetical protein [Sideroxydans lithotrophicus ES-1]|uniref:Uncharacterized protein n=1 Tax=Sideroxydans lithotrophicus (strain ES-1) TaxID=580332 RepID=D5CQU4_SIDLE|nr:conserved hypothetical protein [Sideroxydans lithotrophicus ES-1]
MSELFDTDNSHLPLPFTGETLYSWCARFHRINGNTSARLTSRQLFDDSTAGLRHDFPTQLNVFLGRTNQLLGSADELIYQRTVFGIFSPFLATSAIRSIAENMNEGGDVHIKHHLGVLPSRAGSAAPLKACPSCMRSETNSLGTPWWHIEHQWPTNRVCQTHGDYLLLPPQAFHSRVLKEWFLPADVQWQADAIPNEQVLIKLHKLNEWSCYLVTRSQNPFDSDLLRLTYHIRAKAMGWTTMDGSLKFSQIRAAFRESYSCLEELRGFEFIGETRQDHGGFLGSLLRQFDGNRHPLKHALMMDFLFGEPMHFNSEYQRILSISIWLDRKDLWAELTEERNQLKLMVAELGYSVNAAANQLGLPVGQAVRYLKMEGVEYKRRPRVLNPEKESALRQLLGSGEDRELIAATLGIRKTFIKDYLAQDSILRDAWKKANLAKQTEKYRQHLVQLLSEHPNDSIKQLKQIPGNGIQWLARNDRQWLENTLPSLWRDSSSTPDTTC